MLLAERIMKLRKDCNWSQEELAYKLDISRQSVSKWESGASTPDLDKIIKLANIFGVTTDSLLISDERIENTVKQEFPKPTPKNKKVTLQEANDYCESKILIGKKVGLGASIIMLSIIPFFALLGLAETDVVTEDLATIAGLIILLFGVAGGVSIIISSNTLKRNFDIFEDSEFELGYGIKEGLTNEYSNKIAVSITLFIISALPVIIAGVLDYNDSIIFYGLCLTIFLSSLGVYLIIPANSRKEAIECVLSEGEFTPKRREENKRAEKLGGFYWPLVVAIYLGWSFWTGKWGFTWIVWPIAGVGFAALQGFVGMFDKN